MGNQQGTPNDLESFKKYSGLTIKHVMMLRERLEMLSEADLSITKDAFSLAMKTKQEETDRVFRIFDLSSAGKIETLEFVCALSLLAHADLREKCDLMFGLYDFDRNRTMNKQELVILIKTVLTTLNAISSKGECSIQEAQNIADGILKRYDTNEDASISNKEFYSFVSKDPDIVKMLLSYGLISLQDLRFNFGEPSQNDLSVPEVDSDLENEIYKSRIVKTNEDELIALGVDVKSDGNSIENLNWYKQLVKDNMLFDPDDPENVAGNPPNATLEIDHVFGYRCFDTRNNVRYTPDNEIIYHSGSLILKHGQRQQFFMEHTDDVTCLDVWEHLVVSGQMGSRPSILVWDSKTLEIRAVFRGVLSIGVSNICISNDGRKLAAVGMDEDQCIVVYDIEKAAQSRITGKRDESLLANGKGPVVEIFDIKFDKNDKQIIIACMGEVNFVTYENNVLRVLKGTWDQKYCCYQAVLSIGLLDSAIIVGTFKGQLLQWRGSRVTMAINDAHKGPITCMYTCKNVIGILTGSKDEQIILWDATLKKIQIIDFKLEKIRNVKITSICQSQDREQILIGTRIGQIIEIKNFKQKILAYSHYDGKLEALICHPSKNIFFTAGEDQLVMMWDMENRCLLNWQRYDFCIKCLEVNDKFLIGGCNNGTILILEQEQLKIHKDFKDRDSEITNVKLLQEYLIVYYSQPYYEFFIYNVKQNFKKILTISGRPGNCTSIDASISKQFLITLDTQELFCMDLMQKKLTKYKEDEWLTFTSIYGWQVKGIWPENTNGNEITTLDRDIEKKVIAVGDKYGSIKLYKYPAYKKNASYYRYSGHSNKISKIRFSYNSQYLISIGEQEKNIIQWKFCVEENIIQQNSIFHKHNKSKTQQDEQQNNEQINQTINKPFLDIIKLDEQDEIQYNLPKTYLNLSYIFGVQTNYQGYPLFGQMKYAGQQKIVFPVGCLCIIQDTKIEQSSPYRKQNYYYGHTQQIICLSVHPKGQIIATGTCINEINLWDVDTRQTLIQIRGYFNNGIGILRFNVDGTQLLGCGNDQYNSICIYDWQANRIICNSKVDKSKIKDCCFISNVEFITISKFIRKWQIRGRNLSFDQYSHEVTSIAYAFNSEIITGNEKGEIQQLKNKQMNSTQAHQGRINQLISQKQNLYSAGDDGRIILWHFNQNQLQQKEQFCQQQLPPILSIDIKNDYIILLTNTCEIRELIITHANIRSTDIIKGHGQDIQGLAIQKNKIYTCSNDKTIKIWDIRNRCCYINSDQFQYELKQIDIYNNLICIGDQRGYLYLLDEKLNILQQVSTLYNQKQKTINYEISKIKFSPDGLRLCVGAINGPSHIEIWNIYKQLFEKERHIIINCGFTGGILNMDWSEDSQYLLAATSNYELKCISITKQRDVQYNYDIKWQTQTCQYGPGLQYIYPKNLGEDITCVYLNKSILFVGDKFGTLSIFNYPTTSNCSRQYLGHSQNINSILFCQEQQQQYIISVGNSAIFIWSIDNDQPTQLDSELLKLLDLNQQQHIIKKQGLEKYGITDTQQQQQQQQQQNEEDYSNKIHVKPWVSNIKEPTTYYKDPLNQNTPPLIDLEIEHAFGYRGNDCKNNIKFLKSGNIVYHTASLGIVLDITNNEQKIFNLHNDDIIALDLHSDGIRVATGEINTGLIYIWDCNTLQPLCKFTQLNDGIKSLNFSYSTYLIALSMDQLSTIAIFDINTKSIDGGSLVYKYQTGKQIIKEIKWLNEQTFITIGPLHFKEWIIKQQLYVTNINLPDNNTIFNTFLINDEEIYIADITGKVFIYLKKQLQHILQHHQQQVDALTYTRDYFITGSKDQQIIIYDIRQIKEEFILQFKLLDLSKQVFQPQIKSLCYNDQKLIVGTFGCEIWELSIKENKILNTSKFIPKILMKGHYAPSKLSELWGLTIEGDFIYTCGDDATLRQWSVSQKKQIQLIKTVLDSNYVEIKQDENNIFPDSVRGRSIAANQDFIVVGFKDGGVRIYDKDMKQKSYQKIAKDWISDIKFSPNNDYITFGSHDNCIYIYTFPEMIIHLKPLRKHSYYIKNIDYSIDGTKLISTCGGFDLIYWDTILGKQLPQGRNTLRDEKWNTWTNILGWPVQGIWNENYTGQEINCVCRSNFTFATKSPDNYYLLAVGNDFNEILLYRYPCINRKSIPLIRKGHSSPVSQIKFTQDDKYLITMGGEDMTIILWRVIKKL